MNTFNVSDFLDEHAGDLALSLSEWEAVAELLQKAYDRGYLDYEAILIGTLDARKPDEVQYRLRHVSDGLKIYSARAEAEAQVESMAGLTPGVHRVVQSRGRYGTEWSEWMDA